MNNERRKEIWNIAEIVINAFRIDIPIKNIDEVVRKMGGTIKEELITDKLSDGYISKNGEGFIIVLSPNQSPIRRTFTIAHELGHLFLHLNYSNREEWEKVNENLIYNRFGNSEQEYEANEFAASLLMPKDKYKEVMDSNTDPDNVTVYTGNIAQYFNVSVDAASNRGKWLGFLEW